MAKLRHLLPDDAPRDAELIELTLAGDDGAFAVLVERYQRKIFRMALAIVRNDTDADTVTQDTFVTAYLNLRGFEGRSELETWLTRIAINKSRDVLRARRWRFVPLAPGGDDGESALDPPDERPDAERLVMADQIAAAIDAAVEDLSAQQKVIFRLRHYEDMALEDIARVLDLAPGTVRAHLFRAVHKVRKALEGWVSSAKSAEVEV